MAFDACMMRAVLSEFSSEFPTAKIERVFQPQNDEIDLLVHYGKASRRLVFNVGPNAPRLQLSDVQKENPKVAPMFCMLLRKYLVGAKIVSVSQPNFDRIADFGLSCYDEMGFLTEKRVICEIMGKYANLIITDKDYKVISALKIIDFSQSTVRQVLPGLKYQVPKMQEKLSSLVIDKALFLERLSAFPPERTVEKFITGTYSGIATQIAHELAFRATGNIDVPLCRVNVERLYSVFLEWQELLISEKYCPTVVFSDDGAPRDYSYMDITYLGDGIRKRSFERLSDMLDCYFAEKDRLEHIHQRSRDITNLINSAIQRTEKKLSLQREALADSSKGEEYKRYGDLITQNIYLMKRGVEELSCVDYSDETMPTVSIPLDKRLSPAQNAQKYYKLYTKAKTRKTVLTEQIRIWEEELSYLIGVRDFLSLAESESDVLEIREELYRSGYASKMRGYTPDKKQKIAPYKFKTSGGFTVLVGRNNTQNDNITLHLADKNDIWFHTKGFPGSHAVLITEGLEPSDADYTEAASLAALYSKASGDNIAVDYTRVKNIKKPQGAKPGFVIYKTNFTAYVSAMDREQALKMRIK
ncbi:MAG: NFACT family protein [Clostridia bacterium]|nr:NFACT family protein [Clostridia bacterium]